MKTTIWIGVFDDVDRNSPPVVVTGTDRHEVVETIADCFTAGEGEAQIALAELQDNDQHYSKYRDAAFIREHTIELPPPPVGVNAELLAALRKADHDLEAILDDEGAQVSSKTGFAIAAVQDNINAAIAAAEAGQVEHDGVVEVEGAITAEDWKAALEEHRDKVERRKAAQPTQEQMDDFPIEDWRYDVANGDTRRGYNEWVLENAAQAAEMQEG